MLGALLRDILQPAAQFGKLVADASFPGTFAKVRTSGPNSAGEHCRITSSSGGVPVRQWTLPDQ
jgi:hypothetical protein